MSQIVSMTGPISSLRDRFVRLPFRCLFSSPRGRFLSGFRSVCTLKAKDVVVGGNHNRDFVVVVVSSAHQWYGVVFCL